MAHIQLKYVHVTTLCPTKNFVLLREEAVDGITLAEAICLDTKTGDAVFFVCSEVGNSLPRST